VLGNGRRTTGAGTVVQGVNCNPPDIDHRINAYTVTTATYCYMEKQRECVNIILYTAIWTRGTGTCIICEKHVAGDESRCFSAIAACRSCQTTLSLFRLTFDPSRKTASA